ncbi:MAG TPA: diacylglycerol kinase family protein, partial [Dehalococcoidia bacterium]|nr:diacylglycerol kinase family protein [Dehalococcoidia bacterium]
AVARDAIATGQYDALLSLGGDGTVHTAVNGLLRRPPDDRPPLAIVGLGTGNDSARQLGLPHDPDRCADRIVAGEARPIDLIRVTPADGTTEYAINSTGWGFVGEVLRRLDRGDGRWAKPVSGKLFYLAGTIAAWRVHQARPVQVILDGRIVWDGPCYAVIVANGALFGGGIPIAPVARLDDGRLEVVLVRARDRRHMLRLLPIVHRGRHLAHADFRHASGRRVEVGGEGLIDADGELLGAGGLTAEVAPAAIRICR